jgi:hypothetical protein
MTPIRNAASLALVLALAGAGSASASVVVLGNGDSIILDDLIDAGGQFIVDDKLFTIESWRSDVFNAGTISIIGFIALNPNEYGFRNIGFDIVGPFGDGTPGNTEVHEGNLQYTVEVLPQYYQQGVRIHDARLTFNGSAGNPGSFARVDESLFDADTNSFLGQLEVFYNANTPPQIQMTDEVVFGLPGYRALEVNKDLKFFSPTAEGFSTASFIRQEFSQIPAPGALALLGAAGLAARRRRR